MYVLYRKKKIQQYNTKLLKNDMKKMFFQSNFFCIMSFFIIVKGRRHQKRPKTYWILINIRRYFVQISQDLIITKILIHINHSIISIVS